MDHAGISAVTGSDDGHQLSVAIRQQIEQVDRRVMGGGEVYAAEREEIRRATQTVKQLRIHLELEEFLHTLNPGSGKPQLLLGFRSVRCGSVVLKVYGRARPNEAAVQEFWAGAGVSVVEVLAAGDDPVSWLLMPMISGAPPELGEVNALTGALAEIMTTAHAVYSPAVGCPCDLYTGIAGHLGVVLAALRRHGYALPDGWKVAARRLYRSGDPTFLHGDLAPSNLLREPSGRIRMLDTCGYTGPAEFDGARWCARVGGSQRALPLLNNWMRTESGLDVQLARALLGLELLMEAGVRELVKDERHQSWERKDKETRRCLTLGARLAGLAS
ncbi:MAG: phosphotransferase family protein [Pseudonocardiaceae bacterium]